MYPVQWDPAAQWMTRIELHSVLLITYFSVAPVAEIFAISPAGLSVYPTPKKEH